MKNRKKKGLHPGVAVVFLLAGGGFAAKSLLGSSASAPSGGSQESFAVEIAGEVAADAGASRDLLAVHGSYDRRTRVQLAFHAPAEVEPGAAPASETAARSDDGWQGEDPPSLRLGVVLISDAVRRASLGGKIVGVGDSIGDAVVREIERGRVFVQWRGRGLTYELDGEVPVEFRAEVARREAERKRAADTNEGGETDRASAPGNEPAAGGDPRQAPKQESKQ